MSTTPEGKLVSKTMKWLRGLPNTYAVKINDSINVGLPDIFGHHRGIAFYIELKSAKGRLSDRQRYELDKIMLSGGRVFVARSIEEVQGQMEAWFGSNLSEARQARAGDAADEGRLKKPSAGRGRASDGAVVKSHQNTRNFVGNGPGE